MYAYYTKFRTLECQRGVNPSCQCANLTYWTKTNAPTARGGKKKPHLSAGGTERAKNFLKADY